VYFDYPNSVFEKSEGDRTVGIHDNIYSSSESPFEFEQHNHRSYILHFDSPPIYDTKDEDDMIVFDPDEIQTEECMPSTARMHLQDRGSYILDMVNGDRVFVSQ